MGHFLRRCPELLPQWYAADLAASLFLVLLEVSIERP